MRPVPRLAQLEQRAPRDHLAAMAQEVLQHLLEIQRSRLAIHQRHHVDAEHALHLGVLVEVVEHDLRHFVALQFHHHAHAILVGLVAELGDALQFLVLHQFGDLFQQPRLVDLVGKLGNHQPVAAGVRIGFDLGACAHIDAAAAGGIGLDDAAGAVDEARGGKIRARHVLHQATDGDVRVVDEGDAGIDGLGQAVGRNVGGHAHSDAGRTVDQEVRQARRQHGRFVFRFVVVGHEIDGFLVDIGEHFVGDARHAHFGVTHGRRGVAIHRTEVALPVHQHVSHGKRLRHADDGVVDGSIAVGVVLTDDVTHHAGGFLVGLVPVIAEFVHRVQDTPVNRLEPVPYIGKRPPDNHAHGVVEVGLLHLLLEVDRQDFLREFGHRQVLWEEKKKAGAKPAILLLSGAFQSVGVYHADPPHCSPGDGRKQHPGDSLRASSGNH